MTRRSVVTPLVVVVALAVGFAGGWFAHRRPAPTAESRPAVVSAATGTISGRLLAVGGPATGEPRPLPGSIYVASQKALSIPMAPVVTLDVGSDGRYSIATRPGTYVLTGLSPWYNGGRTTCYANGHVTVAPGAQVVADVFCQEM